MNIAKPQRNKKKKEKRENMGKQKVQNKIGRKIQIYQ